MAELTHFFAAAIFCKQRNEPCGHCQSCQLVAMNEHPDLMLIAPEKVGQVIKIEQIRLLHPIVFTSPQLSTARVVVINPTEKLTLSAANALLKVLEEPPENVYFMLIAEHISSIPATIVSRCQRWNTALLSEFEDNYLDQGKLYAAESQRGKLFAERELLITQLNDLLNKKITANALAAKWAVYEFNDLIWLIYLMTAQMITDHLQGHDSTTEPCLMRFYQQTPVIKPVILFAQLDKLNEIIKQLNHAISINQLLALEDFLLGYR